MKNKLILIAFICIMIILGGLSYVVLRVNIKSEKGDELYVKMKEINDNQSLIGLSSEEVVELLGKPEYEYEYKHGEKKKQYMYYAGEIIKEPILGNTIAFDSYQMDVFFNDNDKAEQTSMTIIP